MIAEAHNPLFIAGPTGVGKSSLAVELAIQLDGEIICGDAFQIYHGLPILTAQPTPAMLARVPHHLYGCVSPQETFSAARFATLALPVIAEVSARGRVPIIVGGSGLYFSALCGTLDSLPEPDPALRARITALSPAKTLEYLRQADPAALETIDTKNHRRVTRALEIVLQTGRPLAHSRRAATRPPPFPIRGILLTRDKEILHRRITENIHQQFENGVVEEVMAAGEVSSTAARTIGFTEVQAVALGVMTREEATAVITRACTQYAKRQLTWFRNKTHFSAIEVPPNEALADTLKHIVQVFS